MSRLRATTAAALGIVRRWPPVHAVVHQVALQLIKTRWGERFVRGVVGPQAQTDAEYRAWVQAYDTLSEPDRDAIRAHIDRLSERPLISVVMTAWRSDPPCCRRRCPRCAPSSIRTGSCASPTTARRARRPGTR